jgi:hypothetical protein
MWRIQENLGDHPIPENYYGYLSVNTIIVQRQIRICLCANAYLFVLESIYLYEGVGKISKEEVKS